MLPGRPQLTRDQYERIREGMTRADVEAALERSQAGHLDYGCIKSGQYAQTGVGACRIRAWRGLQRPRDYAVHAHSSRVHQGRDNDVSLFDRGDLAHLYAAHLDLGVLVHDQAGALRDHRHRHGFGEGALKQTHRQGEDSGDDDDCEQSDQGRYVIARPDPTGWSEIGGA